MAKLQYKTRGGASPQGKPRVFFCCHEQDHAACFEEISNELLKLQNCAVWYLEEGTVDETLLSDLQQMQLFVMPVTTRLLTTPNAALDILFPFAEANHIPVLPLMREQGLETLFNQKCGDRQFLNPYDRDPTAIPYGEKLEKYLSSVLVGDSLAEKVRAAFRAYVFLSYRKKDRRHARELMALIHKNDFCRDIAIWYDEYLTPGENFNDAIKAALEKSGLFVLAVTPNLVNEVNYIMTTEYPMAVEAGKRVLPVEMLATDRDSLNGSYPGLPDPTDGHDEETLTAALLQAVTSLALAQQPKDPEHNFFIGLAYLSGIDVEVDHEKALQLITSAAETGLPEAMEKLTSMYREGLGVARSYETAIYWQEKLADHYEAAYAVNPTRNNALEFVLSLWQLGDWLFELRKLDKALSAYNRMQQFCEAGMQDAAPYNFTKRYLSVSYHKIGEVCKAQGNLSDALKWYEISLRLSENVALETGTAKALRMLSVNYANIGDLCKARGNLEEAQKWQQKALHLRQMLVAQNGEAEDRQDLASSYERMGDLCKVQGDLPGALEYYEKSLQLRQVLVEERGAASDRRELAISHERIGSIRGAYGDLSAAKKHYECMLEILQVLAEETGAVEARQDLSVSYERMGDFCKAQGDLTGALEWYQKASQLTQVLAEATGTVEDRRSLSVGYEHIGDILEAQGKLRSALQWQEKALQLRQMLAEETGTVQANRDLSVSYVKVGDIKRDLQDLFASLDDYEKALQLRLSLVNQTGTMEAQWDLFVCYERIGDLRKVGDDIHGALEYHEKALQIAKKLTEETDTVDKRRGLCLSYNKVGDIRRMRGDISGALEYHEEALQTAKRLAEQTDMARDWDLVALSLFNCGCVTVDAGRRKQIWMEAYTIWNTLVMRYPQIGMYRQRRDIVKRYLD